MPSLYKKVHRPTTLRAAWNIVRANCLTSTSDATRAAAELFQQSAEKNLRKISAQLKSHSFTFPAAIGVPIEKPGKKAIRPLVIAPIETRIVQRAILDVMVRELPFIKDIFRLQFNLGGVPEGGVPKAIERAYRASLDYAYFIRTDIKAFFDNVPRRRLLDLVCPHTSDSDFNELLERAVTVELDNLARLGPHRDAFPLGEKGVAQGSCLSPLLCNLLLHDLDQKLNSNDVVCVRYIDDFILFAPNAAKARGALRSARKYLTALGLDAYDPREDSTKADEGECAKGFDFLGCRLTPDAIRPGEKARKSLRTKVGTLLDSGLVSQRHIKLALKQNPLPKDDPTLLYTLWRVSNTIKAWGASFSFCTDRRVFQQLDQEIDQKLEEFKRDYRRKTETMSLLDRRRLSGIDLLVDSSEDKKFIELVETRNGRHL